VVLGCCISLTAIALIPSASNFWQLLAFGLLQSIGDAGAMPASSAMAVDEGRKFGMGMAMAAFTLALSFGMALGPILAGIFADVLGISAVFYFAAAVILFFAGAFSWFTR